VFLNLSFVGNAPLHREQRANVALYAPAISHRMKIGRVRISQHGPSNPTLLSLVFVLLTIYSHDLVLKVIT
jgi:hypothetical protein